MQDRKEHSIGFVKNIKNTLHDWWMSYDRKLWTACIFVYGSLLLLVVSVGVILFTHFNLFHTEPTSARYMLSALVQSQAAIVAIVISLTLIAVQLTASAYSPRVIDIFKKNPDMWLLLGCYGVSIFYGFIVLKLVEGAGGEAVSQSVIWSIGRFSVSFEFYVSLAYWLGVFTFVALFPYMLNIIGLLKSGNIIKRLATEISKDKILNSEEDPIQPIMDIVHGSIMKYDIATTRVGLKAVTDRVIKIINSDDEEEISGHFCKHLERVGKLAVSRMDEESTKEVIGQLDFFGESTAEKGLQCATAQTAEFLSAIGVTAADKGLVVATWRAVEFLEAVGKAAADKGLEKATWHVALSLGVFGRSTAEKGLVGATRQIAWTLEAVGRTAAGKRFESATKKVAISLGDVGKAAAEKGLESATQRVVESLVALGRTAADKRLKDVAREAAMYLAKLAILSEEIVKTAIQDYESRLEEHDRESFQKFMKLYEQELEKLRVKRRT
uniref:DUF2254 domain-containing protein n=1 Tax=Candidatus Methanophaga sp. ANME-1 ERB7 TaxID=2759913 RepID=A0A7G9Z907_9EURY|nr:hypothetical protein HGIILDEE_00030 [Methanosarcinales archaeon ANME-1 ERB7]